MYAKVGFLFWFGGGWAFVFIFKLQGYHAKCWSNVNSFCQVNFFFFSKNICRLNFYQQILCKISSVSTCLALCKIGYHLSSHRQNKSRKPIQNPMLCTWLTQQDMGKDRQGEIRLHWNGLYHFTKCHWVAKHVSYAQIKMNWYGLPKQVETQ